MFSTFAPSFIFCHYGELWLKGKNKPYFLRILKRNVEKQVGVSPKIERELMIVPYSEEYYNKLRYVFGIDGYGAGVEVDRNINNIINYSVALAKYGVKNNDSIVVNVTRKDKSYELTSPEIEKRIKERLEHEGIPIEKKGNVKLMVKVDKKVKIYIIPIREWYGTRFMNGAGGLPVGTTGKVCVMLSGGIDSPVAAWMMMKRGCKPVFVHFHSVEGFSPFDGMGKKIGDMILTLKQYSPDELTLYTIDFGPIIRRILPLVPPKDRLVVYRRYMYKITEEIMKKEKCKAYVSGESLAQVASQTLDNLSVIEHSTKYPILRPLIGMDKKEIIALAKHIGTFDHSIKQYVDTCSRFLPKHPNLSMNEELAKKYENEIGEIKTHYVKFKI